MSKVRESEEHQSKKDILYENCLYFYFLQVLHLCTGLFSAQKASKSTPSLFSSLSKKMKEKKIRNVLIKLTLYHVISIFNQKQIHE